MKKLLSSLLATAALLSLANCETYDDDDDDHRHHGGSTTTTTTEETTLRTPQSTTVETQTTRSY